MVFPTEFKSNKKESYAGKAIRSPWEVLEEYRSADRQKRLDMWLTFRDLREEFNQVEKVLKRKPKSK